MEHLPRPEGAWAIATALALVACGQAESEGSAPPGAAGGAASPRGALAADAPACAERPPEVHNVVIDVFEVTDVGAPREIWRAANLDGHVVARGTGKPAELAELPNDFSFDMPSELGWLMLEGSAPPVAAERVAASTPDAGAPSAARWLLLGPGDLASVPINADDEVHVEVNRFRPPFYLTPSWTFAMTSHERLLLLDELRDVSAWPTTSNGMTFNQAAPLCQTSDGDCYYYYEHSLDVTTPDGASATLDSFATAEVGSYRLHHRVTGSVGLVREGIDVNNFCADRKQAWTLSAVTAMLLPPVD